MFNEIAFYVTDSGRMPVVDFLGELSDKDAAKCYAYIDLLIENGNTLPANIMKHLERGLWELRPEFGGSEFRLFYFAVIDDVFVMLHAVRKKSQKVRRKDIELALRRMEECRP